MSGAPRLRPPVPALGLALALSVAAGEPAEAARTLIADLSSREIAITTGFTGTELLLFGTKDPGGDVVVVIRGPARDEMVRRRERLAGVWVYGAAMIFRGLPAFYHVAATRPLEEIAAPAVLSARRIGAERLRLRAAGGSAADDRETVQAYRKALIRNKTGQRLYAYEPVGIEVAGGRLFRTAVDFPANVPTGPYRVEVFLFDGGREIGRSESTLVVRKAGIEAAVFNLAHQRSALYGAAAILIALSFGWLAGVIFRS